jgi:CheY-like chemotaxis protein
MKRILCIEDNPRTANAMRRVLVGLGADVVVADCGNGAMDLLSDAATLANPFAIIIVDVRIPIEPPDSEHWVGDLGFQIIKKIRQNLYLLECPETPIVVFTGYDNYDDCLMAGALGLTAYLPKLDGKSGKSQLKRLFDKCKDILSHSPSGPNGKEVWLVKNRNALKCRFASGACLVVDIGRVPMGFTSFTLIDGFAVIHCENCDAARLIIAKERSLRWCDTLIVHYPFT